MTPRLLRRGALLLAGLGVAYVSATAYVSTVSALQAEEWNAWLTQATAELDYR